MKESLPKNQVFIPHDSIEWVSHAIVSKQVIKNQAGNITLFAFDEGEELTEHTSPYDAVVEVLEGKVQITIGGTDHTLSDREAIIMQANIPHALKAMSPAKFILTLIKGD